MRSRSLKSPSLFIRILTKQDVYMDFYDIQSESTISVGGSSPTIKPCHIFGVRKGVKNNLIFPDEETVIFPSGNHCVRYNIYLRETKFIYGVKGSKGLKALALSPDRRYLAVSESGKWGSITIFDLLNEKKKQVLKGSDYGVQEFACMAFSADSKYLLGQSGGPKWTLFYWEWEKKELITTVTATRRGRISEVSFNPRDNAEVCVSGNKVFKIFRLKKGSLTQTNSYNMDNHDVLCHVWMSANCIIAGTDTGKLLMLKSRKPYNLERPCARQTSSSAQLTAISAIAPYSNGFACSAGPGLVCLYEKPKDKDTYKKTAEIRIPVDTTGNQQLQTIAAMCISPAEETLAISTDRGQLYYISLTLSNISESKQAQLKFLSHSLHSDSITGLSVCVDPAKTLVATCSKDRTIHIWNYKTRSLEYFKAFDEEPLCVSMHPNGLSILVGFSTEVCHMKIINSKIYTVQTFYIRNCTQCSFNHDGNMFAAASRNVIHLYNIRTQERLDLLGHVKKVQTLEWSKDDHRLMSCGADGFLYVWNTLTGAQESKNSNDRSYVDATFSPDNNRILAVDRLNLQEIHEKTIQSEMASDGTNYTAITMTHSGQTVFIGTATGTVKAIEYINGKEKILTEHQAHSGPITKMGVTPCDQFLLTASNDGSLLIWAITEQEGRMLDEEKAMQYAEEVICTKGYLTDMEQTIDELKTQIEWLTEDQEHKMNVKDVECYQKINDNMQGYLQQIESLKNQIQVLNIEKEGQKDSHQKAMNEMMEKHTENLKDQERSHLLDMTDGCERHHELQKKMQKMQQEHEEKLRKTEDSHRCVLEHNNQSYEVTLKELQNKLEEAKNSEEKQKKIKDAAESELMEICCDYELDLQTEEKEKQSAQDKMRFMEKDISQNQTLKGEMRKQRLKIHKLEKDMEDLKFLLKHTKKTITVLTRENEEQKKTISDQEQYIEELQETVQNLEKSCHQKQEELTATLQSEKANKDSRLKYLKEKSDVERLEKKVQENKETFRLVDIEIARTKSSNEKTIADLRKQLKLKDQALHTEKQRVISTNTTLQRMKSDLHKCSRFIQEPKKLKENIMDLHKRYIHKQDVNITVDAEVTQEHTKQMDHFQNILATERRKWERDIETEKERYIKIMKENSTLIQLLNEQKKRSLGPLTTVKEKKVKTTSTVNPRTQRPASTLQPQSPVNQRLKTNPLDKTQRQISTRQSPLSRPKLPPIFSNRKAR